MEKGARPAGRCAFIRSSTRLATGNTRDRSENRLAGNAVNITPADADIVQFADRQPLKLTNCRAVTPPIAIAAKKRICFSKPHPGILDFLTDGIAQGASLGLSTLQALGSGLLRPLESAETLLDTAAMGWSSLRAGLTPPAEIPLNDEIGRQRQLDWRTLDLSEVRDVRKQLDGSVNDVVLAVVAGGLRSFLRRRRIKLSGLDVRIVVPVDTRTGDEDAALGNKVSAWFLSLPVGERDPRRRFQKIHAQTLELKRTSAESGVDAFLEFADWAGSTRLTFWGVKLANWARPYNMIVTNVHGPQVRLYLLGSLMRDFTAQVPLFRNQGLSVAAMSYLGKINLGITADRDLVPDFMHFGDALEEAFAELKAVASSPRRPSPSRRRR